MSSIVFIIFALFCVSDYVYGRVVGSVRGMKDVPVMMGAALTDMIPSLELAFILGQFIALFDWSGIGFWTAVQGLWSKTSRSQNTEYMRLYSE